MSKRLLQKNTRFLLTWLPVVLLGCSVLFYIMLRMQAQHMQEKQLLLKQTNVWNAFVASQGNMQSHLTAEFDIQKDQTSTLLNLPSDTSFFYAEKGKHLPFQMLRGIKRWNGNDYLVTTYVSSTEISHLIIKVFITEAFILLLLLIALMILNKRSSGLLWKPFFSTMKNLGEYDINRNQSLLLERKTGTTEFDELNKVLTQLIENVNLSYQHQKQFVENASHEMQTPLAIIRSKLELLINQPGLTEKDAALLDDITQANNRLSQMNRTLLLLAKIESNQFPETEIVDLSLILKQTVQDLQSHYEDFPQLTLSIVEEIRITANPTLIDILISNLVKNAVVHNEPGGKINITLSNSQLIIENTGSTLAVSTERLFERFTKGSHASKTTGLGLALVKQICMLYDFSVNYQHENGWHKVSVAFA